MATKRVCVCFKDFFLFDLNVRGGREGGQEPKQKRQKWKPKFLKHNANLASEVTVDASPTALYAPEQLLPTFF